LPVSVRATLLPSGQVRCISAIGQSSGKAFHSIAIENLHASNAASLWLFKSWSIGRSVVIAYQATQPWHRFLSVQPQVQVRLGSDMGVMQVAESSRFQNSCWSKVRKRFVIHCYILQLRSLTLEDHTLAYNMMIVGSASPSFCMIVKRSATVRRERSRHPFCRSAGSVKN
jgi:hypothetical protein